MVDYRRSREAAEFYFGPVGATFDPITSTGAGMKMQRWNLDLTFKMFGRQKLVIMGLTFDSKFDMLP